MRQPTLFDLLDHNSHFCLRGCSVSQAIEVALRSAPYDRLELRPLRWVDEAVAAQVVEWPFPECWPVTLYANNGRTPVVFDSPAAVERVMYIKKFWQVK